MPSLTIYSPLFRTQRGFTALIWAVVGNHLPIVEYLHSRVEDIVAVEKVKYGEKSAKKSQTFR
jgi:hypothetical protein